MTAAARQTAVEAQQEARGLAHGQVGSEHLLLGLLAVRGDLGGRTLESLGLSLVLVRGRVVQRVGVGDRDSPEVIPFTPTAKRIIALAVEEAERYGDDHVGTQHLLLGIVRESETVAAGILRDLNVDAEQVRDLVRQAASWSGMGSVDDRAAVGAAAVDDVDPRVTVREMDSTAFSSAPELARAFGSAVGEPGWWPADVGEVWYRLLSSPLGDHYQIGSTRRAGVPIVVVGHREAELSGRSPRDWLIGEWSEPAELANVRGLIGAVGVPPRLQGVVYAYGLQIQLLGYETDAEITRAVDTLCRVAPKSKPAAQQACDWPVTAVGAVRMELGTEVAKPGDILRYVLVNTGLRRVRYGAKVALERRSSVGWEPVNAGQGFRAWASHLSPGERSDSKARGADLVVRLPAELPPGRYRLRKGLRVLVGDAPDETEPVEIVVEFTVEGRADRA